jgi:hypothetical protein
MNVSVSSRSWGRTPYLQVKYFDVGLFHLHPTQLINSNDEHCPELLTHFVSCLCKSHVFSPVYLLSVLNKISTKSKSTWFVSGLSAFSKPATNCWPIFSQWESIASFEANCIETVQCSIVFSFQRACLQPSWVDYAGNTLTSVSSPSIPLCHSQMQLAFEVDEDLRTIMCPRGAATQDRRRARYLRICCHNRNRVNRFRSLTDTITLLRCNFEGNIFCASRDPLELWPQLVNFSILQVSVKHLDLSEPISAWIYLTKLFEGRGSNPSDTQNLFSHSFHITGRVACINFDEKTRKRR